MRRFDDDDATAGNLGNGILRRMLACARATPPSTICCAPLSVCMSVSTVRWDGRELSDTALRGSVVPRVADGPKFQINKLEYLESTLSNSNTNLVYFGYAPFLPSISLQLSRPSLPAGATNSPINNRGSKFQPFCLIASDVRSVLLFAPTKLLPLFPRQSNSVRGFRFVINI